MLSWRDRPTGTHYKPDPRFAWAAGLTLVWMMIGLFLTFGFDWQITNVYAHLGLYGHALHHHPPVGLYRANAYPPARVAEINHWMDKYGNMVLFTPVAILVPMWWPPVRWWQIVLVGMLLSIGVEVGQYVAGGRMSQINDVLVNTSGVAVAATIFSIVRWLVRRRRRQARVEPAAVNAMVPSA
jgi:VanZ family protein